MPSWVTEATGPSSSGGNSSSTSTTISTKYVYNELGGLSDPRTSQEAASAGSMIAARTQEPTVVLHIKTSSFGKITCPPNFTELSCWKYFGVALMPFSCILVAPSEPSIEVSAFHHEQPPEAMETLQRCHCTSPLHFSENIWATHHSLKSEGRFRFTIHFTENVLREAPILHSRWSPRVQIKSLTKQLCHHQVSSTKISGDEPREFVDDIMPH